MWMTDEEEMIIKKKYNEGKITEEEFNKLLPRQNEDEDEEIKDIRDGDPLDWNVLFTGALKEETLRQLKTKQKINHFPMSYNIGRKDAMWKNYKIIE